MNMLEALSTIHQNPLGLVARPKPAEGVKPARAIGWNIRTSDWVWLGRNGTQSVVPLFQPRLLFCEWEVITRKELDEE